VFVSRDIVKGDLMCFEWRGISSIPQLKQAYFLAPRQDQVTSAETQRRKTWRLALERYQLIMPGGETGGHEKDLTLR